MPGNRAFVSGLLVLMIHVGTAAPAATPCVGDCNGDGHVTVDENITLAAIALSNAGASACTAGVPSGADVNVLLVTQAVKNALSGCASPPPTPTPVMHTVVVGPNFSLSFSPSSLTIHVGDTVEWTWSGSNHNVVSGSDCTADGLFCSPDDSNCSSAPLSAKGTTYSHTFTAAGTYPYHCSLHCSLGMTGMITVE